MKRVLIVDDEPLFLRSLTEGLQPYCEEFQVLTAAEGSQAVRILEKENVDLLISDLRMPGTDGLALVAYAASAFPSMPIVVMTAYGSEAMGRSLQGLVHTYLEKPFGLPQLLETIRRALSAGEMSGAYAPTLSRFLQLIELERKVCDVWVTAEGKMGVLHCFAGALIGAATGALRGEAAALEILSWQDVHIEVRPAQPGVSGRPIPISKLLSEAARHKEKAQSPEFPLEASLQIEGVQAACLLTLKGELLAGRGASTEIVAGFGPSLALACQMAQRLSGTGVEELTLCSSGWALLVRPLRTPPALLGLLLDGPERLALARLQLGGILRPLQG